MPISIALFQPFFRAFGLGHRKLYATGSYVGRSMLIGSPCVRSLAQDPGRDPWRRALGACPFRRKDPSLNRQRVTLSVTSLRGATRSLHTFDTPHLSPRRMLFFVDVLAVSYAHHQDEQGLVEDLVEHAVIPDAYPPDVLSARGCQKLAGREDIWRVRVGATASAWIGGPAGRTVRDRRGRPRVQTPSDFRTSSSGLRSPGSSRALCAAARSSSSSSRSSRA